MKKLIFCLLVAFAILVNSFIGSLAFTRYADLIFDGEPVEFDKLSEVLATIEINKKKNEKKKARKSNPKKLLPETLEIIEARFADPKNIKLEIDTSQALVKKDKDVQLHIPNTAFLNSIQEATMLWENVDIADIMFSPLTLASGQPDPEDGRNIISFRAIEKPEGAPDASTSFVIINYAKTDEVMFMGKLIMTKPGTILDVDAVFDPTNESCLAFNTTIGSFVTGGNNGGIFSNKIFSSTNDDSWEEVGNNVLPIRLSGHSSIIFDGKIWIIGGITKTGAQYSRKVFSSEDGTNFQEAGTDSLPAGLADHTSLVFDNKMWVIGGMTSSTNTSRKVYNSTDGIIWTEVGTNALPNERASHTSVVFNAKMFVIGGTDAMSVISEKVFSSPDGLTWTEEGTDALPVELTEHSSLILNSKIWLLGGTTNSGISEKVISSNDGLNWQEEVNNLGAGDLLQEGVSSHSSVLFDSKMWIIGGQVATNTNTRKVFNSSNGIAWQQAGADALPFVIDNHNLLVFDDKILIIGGHETSQIIDGGFDALLAAENCENMVATPDLTDTAVRVIGQILGLESSAIGTSAGNRAARGKVRYALTNDDKIGLANLYPNKTKLINHGILAGKVLLKKKPVVGAHVVVEDVSTGEPTVSAISDINGKFTIKAIPAGTYTVYAEPLDGPFRKQGLPLNYFAFNSNVDFVTGTPVTPVVISANQKTKINVSVEELSGSTFNINPQSAVLTEVDVNESGGSSLIPIFIMPGQTLTDVMFWGSNINSNFGTVSVSGEGVTVSNVRNQSIEISPFGTPDEPSDEVPGILVDIMCALDALPGPRNINFIGNILEGDPTSFGLKDQISGGIIVTE